MQNLILTGKDLKNYRESLNLSQRAFARCYGMSRGTLAGYEWEIKPLPKWIVDNITIYDPYFISRCYQMRELDDMLASVFERKPVKRSWIVRLFWKIMGY